MRGAASADTLRISRGAPVSRNNAVLFAVTGTLLTSLSGCSSDHSLGSLCGAPQRGFDITEASVLQDTQGYWGMHDAVVLSFDTSSLPAGAAWRVKSVEIMPMIGDSSFSSYVDGQAVSVEVWDDDNPLTATPWTVTQTFRKDELEWSDVYLSSPASTFEFNQKQAWWRFGFDDVIPTTGMAGETYLVGVSWPSDSVPTLGYSNFNNPCDANWTDYADGFGWVLNTGTTSGNECSWPMLRVNLEVLQVASECTGDSFSYE